MFLAERVIHAISSDSWSVCALRSLALELLQPLLRLLLREDWLEVLDARLQELIALVVVKWILNRKVTQYLRFADLLGRLDHSDFGVKDGLLSIQDALETLSLLDLVDHLPWDRYFFLNLLHKTRDFYNRVLGESH